MYNVETPHAAQEDAASVEQRHDACNGRSGSDTAAAGGVECSDVARMLGTSDGRLRHDYQQFLGELCGAACINGRSLSNQSELLAHAVVELDSDTKHNLNHEDISPVEAD